MTAAEVYELTTEGGITDFARVIASGLRGLAEEPQEQGFVIEDREDSVNAQAREAIFGFSSRRMGTLLGRQAWKCAYTGFDERRVLRQYAIKRPFVPTDGNRPTCVRSESQDISSGRSAGGGFETSLQNNVDLSGLGLPSAVPIYTVLGVGWASAPWQ